MECGKVVQKTFLLPKSSGIDIHQRGEIIICYKEIGIKAFE